MTNKQMEVLRELMWSLEDNGWDAHGPQALANHIAAKLRHLIAVSEEVKEESK